MKHPVLLLLVFLSLFMAAGQAQPPNIILILADDLGWADLGCYGNRFNETPNIDRLAAQGMRFTDFYAAGAVCSPTRASILSGQYQARFGLTAHIPGHWRPFEQLVEPPNAIGIPTNIVTLAERLRAEGYATGHLGKWHLGLKGVPSPAMSGFDTFFDFTGHTVPPARQEPPGREAKRTCEYLAERARQFMESHRARPFFLQVSHYAVHIPLDTTPALRKKYEAKPKVEGYSCHPLYAGLLEELDRSVGAVMETLDRLGLAENTILIFTSDNGGLEREMGGLPGTLNHPLRDEKGSLYEGGIRVPLLVRWPGRIRPGAVSGATSITTDFYPTFLDAAGLEPARGAVLDGVSLLPVFRNPSASLKRAAVYWHYPHYHHSRPSGAVRAGDWKLIEFFDTGEAELYNLRVDLGESRNLAGEQPDKAAHLHAMLRAWRKEVSAQMPQPNPAHDPARANEWWSRAKVEPTQAPGTLRSR